ncbi:hypothetical protein SpCBS45565_g07285 [Spizellomyces sp. 'palustris']|nr:hypothetical protein SpCBS45565_g07285 [Spizellomyces sp. 'palustris']
MPKSPAAPAAAQASAASAAPVAAQKDAQQVEEGEDDQALQKGFKGQASKDMQNVSGYFDERVGDKVDEGKIGKASRKSQASLAMTFLTDVSKKQKAQKSARDKELAKVVLTKEDVELIMNEFQIGKGTAERALRESKGDVLETLRRLIAA